MSLLLINTPIKMNGMVIGPPIGLINLVTYLNREKYNVKFEDFISLQKNNDKRIPLNAVMKYLRSDILTEQLKNQIDFFFNTIDLEKYRYIGLTAHDKYQFFVALAFSKYLRTIYSGKIILGGYFISACSSKELDKFYFVDYLIKGYGEKPLKKIMDGENPEHIPGILYWEKGSLKTNISEAAIPLNMSDIPDFSCIKGEDYRIQINDAFFFMIPYVINRGCIGRCNFCQSHEYLRQSGFKIEYKSADKIVRELEELKMKYNSKFFYFCTDAINTDNRRLSSILDAIIESELDISWSCFARPNLINAEMAKKLRMAGCKFLIFGCESGSQRVLDRMNKRISIQDMSNSLKNCSKNGILPFCYFIVDYPSERFLDFLKTIFFIIKNSLYISGIHLFLYRNSEGSSNYIRTNILDFIPSRSIAKYKRKILLLVDFLFIVLKNTALILIKKPSLLAQYWKNKFNNDPRNDFYHNFHKNIISSKK